MRKARLIKEIEVLKEQYLDYVYENDMSKEEREAGLEPFLFGCCERTTDWIASRLREMGVNAYSQMVIYDDYQHENVERTPSWHWIIRVDYNGEAWLFDAHNEILNMFGWSVMENQPFDEVISVRSPKDVSWDYWDTKEYDMITRVRLEKYGRYNDKS